MAHLKAVMEPVILNYNSFVSFKGANPFLKTFSTPVLFHATDEKCENTLGLAREKEGYFTGKNAPWARKGDVLQWVW